MYESSLYRDDVVLKALAAKDYDTVNINAGAASDNMISCNEELSTLKPVPQSLITKNTVIENLSNISLACGDESESECCHHRIHQKIQLILAKSKAVVAGQDIVIKTDPNRLSMMVTKGEVESICNKKDVDSTLCFEVLKPNPTIAKLDFTGLANFLINYTSRNISDVLKEIKLYESNTTDLQTIKLCEELYDLSLFSDDHALKALAAKNYDSVNFKVGGTLENIVTCNEELSTMKPVPQSLIAKNNAYYLLASTAAKERKSKKICVSEQFVLFSLSHIGIHLDKSISAAVTRVEFLSPTSPSLQQMKPLPASVVNGSGIKVSDPSPQLPMPPTLASSSITTAGGPPALTPAPPSKLMFSRVCRDTGLGGRCVYEKN
ncbi:hypothetical protein YC2023_008860 [Brassica napus]